MTINKSMIGFLQTVPGFFFSSFLSVCQPVNHSWNVTALKEIKSEVFLLSLYLASADMSASFTQTTGSQDSVLLTKAIVREDFGATLYSSVWPIYPSDSQKPRATIHQSVRHQWLLGRHQLVSRPVWLGLQGSLSRAYIMPGFDEV